jgi:hypothetical protein
VLPTGRSGDFGCTPSTDYGIEVDIRYQVLDQSTTPIASSAMEPQETGTFFPGGSYGPNDIGKTRISTTSRLTASDGTFHDAPVGLCQSLPFVTGQTYTATQNITILLNGTSYPCEARASHSVTRQVRMALITVQFKTALVTSKRRGEVMRLLLLLLSLGLLNGPVHAQATNLGSEEMIAKVIESGAIDGVVDKQLSRMGDAAAVDVARIVAGRTLTSQEIDGVLAVLHLAFSRQEIVLTESDRTPRAALFVLQYLALVATDPGVKARAVKEREYMESIVHAAQH